MKTEPAETILSIQSHVAYGVVGNRAAVYILQREGFDVIAINTVQFSNHTGYGSWKGQIFSPEHIQEVLEGVAARDGFKNLKAVLTGYMGERALGDVVLNWVDTIRAQNPNLIYCCDPVMGDVGRGIFVKETLPTFFKEKAIEKATILTPNQYELELLTGLKTETENEVFKACDVLHERGVETVLVTSYTHKDLPKNKIGLLASEKNGSRDSILTPKLPLDPAPNGAGDCTAALFLAEKLKHKHQLTALENTAEKIFKIFEATHQAGTRELQMVKALS